MKFIKTTGSPVSAEELKEELECRCINYTAGDEGVYVNDEDEDIAMSILQELEEAQEED